MDWAALLAGVVVGLVALGCAILCAQETGT